MVYGTVHLLYLGDDENQQRGMKDLRIVVRLL